jgi:hypothetical protein
MCTTSSLRGRTWRVQTRWPVQVKQDCYWPVLSALHRAMSQPTKPRRGHSSMSSQHNEWNILRHQYFST